MDNTHYKYDIAFSFTQRDESLAFHLYKLLKDRVNCFIYSEAQKKLAGRDGETVFNSVFEKETRIVVIIYRNEWGSTKWTRIEETAIRNRGYEEGYDFVILIPLDKPTVPPKWLPKNRIWIGLERWGIESAASVIEARIQEFGGVVREKTVADIAEETERKIKEEKEREKKITYENFRIEFDKLRENLKQQIKEIEEKSGWKFRIIENRREGINICCGGYTLSFDWYQQYRDSLIDASLVFFLVNGYIDENGYYTDPLSSNQMIERVKYYFHINEFDQFGWKYSEKKFKSTQELLTYWLEKFVKLVSEKRLKNK